MLKDLLKGIGGAEGAKSRRDGSQGQSPHPPAPHPGIRRRGVAVLTLAMAVALAAAMPLPADARGKLDQEQSNRDPSAEYSLGEGANSALAQTFTAGITGELDTVALTLRRTGNPGDLVIQIRTTMETPDGTVPSETVLGTAVLQSTRLRTRFAQIFIPIKAIVSAGTTYAIVLLPPPRDEIGGWYSAAVGFVPDDYPRGHVVNSSDFGSTWQIIPANPDLTFKTYVTQQR